jgi:SSS family solute:Na+ symporter
VGAAQEKERQAYLGKIRAVVLDPASPDRLHAVETLAKLDDKAPPAPVLAALRELADTPPGALAAYARWALVNAGAMNDAALAALLESPGEASRSAAYALRHLPRLSAAALEALRETAARAPETYALSAAYVHALGAEKPKARAALLDHATRSDAAPAERYEAAQALGMAGSAAAAGLLAAMLDDEDIDVRVAAADALLLLGRRTPQRMAALDWAVLVLYAIGMLLIGWYFSRRTATTDDYLLGGRNMRSWAVGLSMFATLVSSITYLAAPGEMIRYGPMYLSAILSYPFIVAVVGWGLIPFIMRLRVTSAYEILEARFGLTVRTVGSLFFLSMRLVWMALIIYVTSSKVVVPLLGWGLEAVPVVCAVLGVLTVAYTSMGGLRAVVFTDVTQSFILIGGALASIGVITYSLGGVGAWWPEAWPAHWPEPVLTYDSTARMSVLGMFLAMFTWHVCTHASDQMAIQRYLSTRDARRARQVIAISMCADSVVAATLGMLGLALLAYYQANPHMVPLGASIRTDADRLFPAFIVTGLPAGLTGLVITGIVAAAMSSLSSGVNSSCAVITTDFLGRFNRIRATEAARVRAARVVSWVVGVLVIGLSIFVGAVRGNILEVAYKTVNLLTAPLAGLFLLAYFVPWATAFGALTGAAASLAVVVCINYWEEITGVRGIGFVWALPLGLLTELAVGAFASLIPFGRRQTAPNPSVEAPDPVERVPQ